MNYRVYKFVCNPRQPTADILVSELADLGFESFVQTELGVDAYVPQPDEDAEAVRRLVASLTNGFRVDYTAQTIAEQNWNAVWEADYEPVKVGKKFRVRAPFHPEDRDVEYDIVIQPQMSFGTGHHHTTALMLDLLGRMDVSGKTVLDMGCGTGVLAIAAALMGAAKVVAIDTEERACENTRDNARANEVELEVRHGGAEVLKDELFDVVLANINKNVLKSDMEHYERVLAPGGRIAFSGFFDVDVEELTLCAAKYNLVPAVDKRKNHWACLQFQKESKSTS